MISYADFLQVCFAEDGALLQSAFGLVCHFSAGRSDLRLLSGDAFSVCKRVCCKISSGCLRDSFGIAYVGNNGIFTKKAEVSCLCVPKPPLIDCYVAVC